MNVYSTSTTALFSLGALIGMFSAILFLRSDQILEHLTPAPTIFIPTTINPYNAWLEVQMSNSENLKQPTKFVLEATFLYNTVSIFCLVITKNPQQGRSVLGTWGRHCNQIKFVGTYEDRYVKTNRPPTDFSKYQQFCYAIKYLQSNQA